MLSDRDREILDFERQWFKYAGAKEAAIGERFGLSGIRYFQRLSALIDRPEAHAYDPLTCKRLQRERARKIGARSARRVGL